MSKSERPEYWRIVTTYGKPGERYGRLDIRYSEASAEGWAEMMRASHGADLVNVEIEHSPGRN